MGSGGNFYIHISSFFLIIPVDPRIIKLIHINISNYVIIQAEKSTCKRCRSFEKNPGNSLLLLPGFFKYHIYANRR
jgi:hypothetical protein